MRIISQIITVRHVLNLLESDTYYPVANLEVERLGCNLTSWLTVNSDFKTSFSVCSLVK